MDFEDFIQPEVGITAAVVAAVASPPVRRAVRRGAVLGLAGILTVGDAITAFTRGVSHGAQSAMNQSANGGTRGATAQTAHSSDKPVEGSTVDATDVTEEPSAQQ